MKEYIGSHQVVKPKPNIFPGLTGGGSRISEDGEKIDVGSKKKVALKMLGGGVPNVAFQLGVCEALRDWGFSIPTGCLAEGEERKFHSTVLNPIIGSSSGAFAAACVAMGISKDDLMEGSNQIQPIRESVIKDSLETGIVSLLKRFYTSRKQYTRLKKLVRSHPSQYEHFINTYYPIWGMDELEQYVKEEILNGCDFESLRAQVFVLAVAQEQRLTFIFGDENHPRPDGRDYKFQNGVPIWKAIAGSMSLPPFYQPYHLDHPPDEMKPMGGENVVLIDGETRDPFVTNAAEDSGADLIFVSSFYKVLEYQPRLGHIDDYGILPVILQDRAQGKDARKLSSIRSRQHRKRALEYFREVVDEYCPEEGERMMKRMEEILHFRENVDVVEIQAQDYENEDMSYPYWDPFTLDEEVIDFQYDAGYEIAKEKITERIQPLKLES